MAGQKQDDQLEHTYSRYVRIQDVALKTCQKRLTIGKSGERGPGISILAARYDDEWEYYSMFLRGLYDSASFKGFNFFMYLAYG